MYVLLSMIGDSILCTVCDLGELCKHFIPVEFSNKAGLSLNGESNSNPITEVTQSGGTDFTLQPVGVSYSLFYNQQSNQLVRIYIYMGIYGYVIYYAMFYGWNSFRSMKCQLFCFQPLLMYIDISTTKYFSL